MAKQRGIHQIKGKINNLCYYEQKYVRGGLIRRINEAMSERLKTDPVFANTRHANTIFGGCSMISGLLLSFFGSRNTFLFKPYRHAILTSIIHKYFLSYEDKLPFPAILNKNISSIFFSELIDRIIKNPIFTLFPEIPRSVGELALDDHKDFSFSIDSLTSFCQMYNCIGVQLSITSAHYIYNSYYNENLNGYEQPDNNAGGRVSSVDWYLGIDKTSAVLSTNTGSIDDALTFWIVYARPILYTVGGRPVTGQTGSSCGVVIFYAS